MSDESFYVIAGCAVSLTYYHPRRNARFAAHGALSEKHRTTPDIPSYLRLTMAKTFFIIQRVAQYALGVVIRAAHPKVY